MKADKLNNFFARFKGKITKIDKEGHLGVVKKSSEPIQKNLSKTIVHNKQNSQVITKCLPTKHLLSPEISKKGIEKLLSGTHRLPGNVTPLKYAKKMSRQDKLCSKAGKILIFLSLVNTFFWTSIDYDVNKYYWNRSLLVWNVYHPKLIKFMLISIIHNLPPLSLGQLIKIYKFPYHIVMYIFWLKFVWHN